MDQRKHLILLLSDVYNRMFPCPGQQPKVRDWYLDSFRDLRSFPEIKNINDEREFTRMIKLIKVRHNNVVPTMALGVQQLKKSLDSKLDYEDLDEIQQFLDRFYMSRIGIRMLIGQHVAVHDPNQLPNCIGYINAKMSPIQVAKDASEDARSVCSREYGSAPNVTIYGDPGFTFPYVPTHLHMMVFELVKNSLRAVQERYMESDKPAPPICIIVADGEEDVTIKHSMLNGEENEQLLDAANVGDGDVVLEIGPGIGSLTNVLVESGANVLAIEKDPYMAALVNERFSGTNLVKIAGELSDAPL